MVIAAVAAVPARYGRNAGARTADHRPAAMSSTRSGTRIVVGGAGAAMEPLISMKSSEFASTTTV